MTARNVSAVTAVLLLMGFVAASAQAQPVVTTVPPATVQALANSIVGNDSFITGTPNFEPGSVGGTTTGVGSGDPLAGFPLSDADYGILTTGNAALAPTANSSGTSGVAVGSAATAGRGGSAFDTTILHIPLTAPAGASCVVFTYRFFTDEFGGPGNGDAFIAQLDSNTWSLTGTTLTRPGDFAAAGPAPVSVNGAGDLALQPDFAAGTTYDAATGFLDAKTPVTPGTHNLFLSIFDAGNPNVDSAVFIGHLGFTAEDPSTCQPPSGVLRSSPPAPVLSGVPPLPALPGRAAPLPAGAASVPRTRVPPNNRFRLLRVIHLPDGSLRLRISVPHRGVLGATFARLRRGQPALVRTVRKAIPRRGVFSMRIRPSKAALQRLLRARHVRALVRIKFTPRSGVPLTQVRRFTFGPRRR